MGTLSRIGEVAVAPNTQKQKYGEKENEKARILSKRKNKIKLREKNILIKGR